MINLENFEKYIDSISYDLPSLLDEIYIEAINNHVPVIRKGSIDLLNFIVKLKQPEHILELGTAVGFSGSLMLYYASDTAHLTTIERNDKRISKAKENFHKLGNENKVTLLEGDATIIIDSIEQKFDLIFLDSAKGSYKSLLPKLIKRLNKGGILITDNILQEGDLLIPRSLINQRDRTTYDRMRDFVYDLYHTPNLTTTIIPGGDGIALSVLN